MNYAESISFDAAAMATNDYVSAYMQNTSPDASALSITETSCATTMVVNRPITEPLMLSCVGKKDVTVTVKSNASVHVMFSNAVEQQNIVLNLEPNAFANVYFPPFRKGLSSEQTLLANLKEHANLSVFEISDYASVIKRTMTVDLLGPAAHVSYFGLDHRQSLQKSSLLTINHHAPSTTSEQAFRGIYAGGAHATFLGKVVVDKRAAQSSATQLYRSVLLSNQAKAHVQPQLEIYNGDIKASHGASIGELDNNALFYLRSRGIALHDAKALLLSGMSNDILDRINEPSIKQSLTHTMEHSLRHILEGDA